MGFGGLLGVEGADRRCKKGQSASLGSKSTISADNNLDSNYLRSVLANECSWVFFVTSFNVSFTFIVSAFNLNS